MSFLLTVLAMTLGSLLAHVLMALVKAWWRWEQDRMWE